MADLPSIGIDKLGFYPCALSLNIADLCRARNLDADNFCRRLYCEERAVVGPCEDVVTLAVNAAEPLLSAEDRAHTGLLIVATESAVDQEKPLSSWVHRFLGLPPQCRNFEVKHACYGATAAVQMAVSWLAVQADARAKALVVSSDHALIGLQGVQEPVLGAGAAAVLLSREPAMLAYDQGWSGIHAHEVADIFRPAPGVETGDADESLTSYLDTAEETYNAYVSVVGREVDFDRFFAANIYHVPFGGLAERAHLRLARICLGFNRADARAHFERKSLPSLTYNRRTGGVYGASTFLALLGLLDHAPHLNAGDRIGFYSYGSGSCAEFYSGTLQPAAARVARAANVASALSARRRASIAEYEACERSLDQLIRARDFTPDPDLVPGLWQHHYGGRHRLVLRGLKDYRRTYEWADQ
jgi:3-hydroxy-3-methylglutaryl CoA synthase